VTIRCAVLAANCRLQRSERVLGLAMSALSEAPIWISGILLVGGMTLLSMVGLILVRRRVALEQLRTNNEVAGFKFATVGVLYAVLLAFAVLVVWERVNRAEEHVAQEAGAAAAIYRLAAGLGDQEGASLRDSMTAYLKAAIAKDWPAMARGEQSPIANLALNDVYAAALRYRPVEQRSAVVLTAVLHQLDLITEARRARILVASGIVPGVIWLVLLGGALVTIGFTYFFGTENLRAQMLMTGALSLLIFSGLLIIIAIDHPFAGTVRIEPESLALVLKDFGGASSH
jgi:hypothetical protein